ncbi:hypothetical protein GPS59_14260 [Acinetobacter haemolyticus]|uniref:hypothetical protein n=1 Tax=Acinetobacter haemolyticus TaxID=29430 RepID=UPI0013726A64|nr:hypothetical protein [Acinetobacter haemolyticus]NAR50108.1 hypothetical protein [Acinetobacter haemolyticus]NAR55119.1 hypothetical protein [Acinetobacter haemolyticus]
MNILNTLLGRKKKKLESSGRQYITCVGPGATAEALKSFPLHTLPEGADVNVVEGNGAKYVTVSLPTRYSETVRGEVEKTALKEILIESIELELKGKPVLDECGFNSLMHHAPYIGSVIAKVFDMDVNEFQTFIKQQRLEKSKIVVKIMECKNLSTII